MIACFFVCLGILLLHGVALWGIIQTSSKALFIIGIIAGIILIILYAYALAYGAYTGQL